MKRKRNPELHPTIERISEFAAAWKQWWVKIQPSWHGGESLTRILPAVADWEPILRGGPNGLALVILALSWWIQTVNDNAVFDADLCNAIEDVNWVLLELIEVVSARGGKRARGADTGESKAKK